MTLENYQVLKANNGKKSCIFYLSLQLLYLFSNFVFLEPWKSNQI